MIQRQLSWFLRGQVILFILVFLPHMNRTTILCAFRKNPTHPSVLTYGSCSRLRVSQITSIVSPGSQKSSPSFTVTSDSICGLTSGTHHPSISGVPSSTHCTLLMMISLPVISTTFLACNGGMVVGGIIIFQLLRKRPMRFKHCFTGTA